MPRQPLLFLALAPCAFAQSPILNAPVAPDAVVVVRTGTAHGLSIVDLNGFGGGTGNPNFDPTFTQLAEGDSHYPFNPNLRLQGSLLVPALLGPTSTRNGGSAGVFTLAKDSALSDLHASDEVAHPGDAMLGHPLDLLASNGPGPHGCQVGGGSICAIDGLQRLEFAWGGSSTLQPAAAGTTPVHVAVGTGNPISWAPSPNPPPIQGEPSCLLPRIDGVEPTSVDTPAGLVNLLVPGDPFGFPLAGVPPSGLLAREQNAWFVGVGRPQPLVTACPTYGLRQQVGHCLYVIDHGRSDLAVLSSNSAEVLARIPLPDPTELAMGPNLDLLAVTNRATDTVSFVDIDPRSPSFHSVVATVAVGDAPSGIAWQPDDEDIFVCNEGDDSVSIVSPRALVVRRTLERGLSAPFAVAVTARQWDFSHQRGVYWAFVLDRAGRVSLYESGPNGVNGFGFDALIGQAPMTFANPKAIQPNHGLSPGVWIAHEGQLDPQGVPSGLSGGAITEITLDSSIQGLVPIVFGESPNLRGLSFRVERSIGSDQLSGIPTDLAFDDQLNLGGLPASTPAAADARINGKQLVRRIGGIVRPTNDPAHLLVPVRDPGSEIGSRIDVLALATNTRVDVNPYRPGVQSIPARGARHAVGYFRQ